MKKASLYALLCFCGVILFVVAGFNLVDMGYKISVGVGPFGELTGIDLLLIPLQLLAFIVDVALGIVSGVWASKRILASQTKISSSQDVTHSLEDVWPPPPIVPKE